MQNAAGCHRRPCAAPSVVRSLPRGRARCGVDEAAAQRSPGVVPAPRMPSVPRTLDAGTCCRLPIPPVLSPGPHRCPTAAASLKSRPSGRCLPACHKRTTHTHTPCSLAYTPLPAPLPPPDCCVGRTADGRVHPPPASRLIPHHESICTPPPPPPFKFSAAAHPPPRPATTTAPFSPAPTLATRIPACRPVPRPCATPLLLHNTSVPHLPPPPPHSPPWRCPMLPPLSGQRMYSTKKCKLGLLRERAGGQERRRSTRSTAD